jgi:2-dehydropantoate 2-reductase
MKFAVYGAGAIGGYLGAKLALSGEDVHLIARGPHLAAIKSNGIHIYGENEDILANPNASDKPSEIGPVDFLFLTVKAHGLTDIAPQIHPLLHDETTIISAQNGIPWWYFEKHGGPWDGSDLESVDPNGIISENIDINRVIGCIVYPSTELVEPGVIKHIEGDRFSLGELDGSSSDRIKSLSSSLIKAGLRAPIRPHIRRELWAKLLGNLAFNPISALTRSTIAEMTNDPDIEATAKAMMAEADSVATALGIDIPISIDQRFSGAQKVGDHKTSMLQDLEIGRRLEIDSVMGAVLEIGAKLDIPMPYTNAIYSCLKLLTK